MNYRLESNKNYEILDGDDDVLLLEQATFTVRRFKELASSKFNKIMIQTYVAENNQHLREISDWMRELRINEETIITGVDINWNPTQEGIDCQLLKIGSKGWQRGKLQIEINHNIKSRKTQTSIKFCPDEPPEQKSPLDDIRQSEEYKKLIDKN